MKWLDRLLGKDEISLTVAFSEIDAWLEIVSRSLFRSMIANSDAQYGAICDIRDDLKQNASKLQSAKTPEDTPAPIAKRGLPNRDKMVKQLYSLAEKIVVPTETDYKAILSFYGATISSIDFTFGKSSKNVFYVRSLFPDEVNELLSDLNRLKTALNQLIAPIKGKESQIMNLERVPAIVNDLNDLRSRKEEEKENLSNQEEDLSKLKKKIELDEERLRKIEEDEEWIRFKELENELTSLEEELKALGSEIGRFFSPITKVLNLLKKQDETGRYTLSPEEKRVLSLILSSSIQVLDEDIQEFLRSLKDILNEESFTLQDSKREKTLTSIDTLLNSKPSLLKEKRDSLQSKIDEIEVKLSNPEIMDRRREIDESIKQSRGRLTQLQEGVERSKRHLISLDEEITAKKRSLLGALEKVSGKKIEVEF
ncbi:MAG: hypothetical protein SYNGOMJ08_00604 [Candidatus Syntrophoarchaeum sp. GoM_oil]|nr:MAG: hypothetical protein SYNGOMJ08_00604 [Candidatus Syntrophoarchaeum sp. GoM_oil]